MKILSWLSMAITTIYMLFAAVAAHVNEPGWAVVLVGVALILWTSIRNDF